jgi:hypothetical protein
MRTSRRAVGLKAGDYSHEIDLVDRESLPPSPRRGSDDDGTSSGQAATRRSTSSGKGKAVQSSEERLSSTRSDDAPEAPTQDPRVAGPSIEVQGK